MTNLYELQLGLEATYNKNQQVPKISLLIKESEIIPEPDEDDEESLEQYNMVVNLLTQLAIRKRIPVEVALGIIRGSSDLETASMIIEYCVESGLATHQDDTLIVAVELSHEVEQEIRLHMYPPPLVVEPKKLKNNKDTGYYIGTGSVMTRGSHTSKDVCLDVLNILNSFRYNLDLGVLAHSSKFKAIIKRKPDQSLHNYNKAVRQWTIFDSETRQLIDLYYKDKNLWFTHAYDRRGRFYCRGYHINYQGVEWAKAIVQFTPQLIMSDEE